ncbi:MAG TPA: DUF1203 domain-containing protein [Gaiellaceae bacterium]|jgi:hypothetical protein
MTAITAKRFAVEGLPDEVATFVREQGRDPVWGHAAVTELATGFGPCRACLRTFRAGEEMRTLFTHDTYSGAAGFPQPGPVYIHAEECPRYESGTFPPELRALELTFEGVAAGPRVVALERTNGEDAEGAIGRLLELPEVGYVNVRNTEAGCFVARIER